MKYLLIGLIAVYQKTLSPDHGLLKGQFPYGACRFHPTCSEYTKQSIRKFGAVKGTWQGMKRLGRCHPWRRGGHDPVKAG